MSRKYRVAEQHIKTLKTECKRRKQTIESQQVSHFVMNMVTNFAVHNLYSAPILNQPFVKRLKL